MVETTIKGLKFKVEPEPSDYWGWIREGRYDNEFNVYDALLKPEHTFVDLGAWVGAHSLYASTRAGKVIAVEPDPIAYPILVKNLGAAERITTSYSVAISDHQGTVKLGSGWLGASTTRANPNAGGGIGPWDEEQTCEVPCMTLQRLCQYVPSKLFIKVDIEGSEESVLKEIDFLRECKPTMLVELHPFWWRNEAQTWKDFEAVKALYNGAYELHHKNSNTWVLVNA